MEFKITVLPGDGIGVEVTREAVAALEAVGTHFGHEFSFTEQLIGGAALDALGAPLPEETLKACLASDAVFLGAVGGPAYDANPPALKPETGLLALRAGLGVYANLRPAFLYDSLVDASPIKADIIRGTDLVIVRELAGGLYFGQPRAIEDDRGLNTLVYTAPEVERVARVAFELARGRRGKVTSVDKANVLESSQLWRKVVTRIAADYPDVQLEHGYVDSCAMALVTRPRSFDVIVTENLFGDILSDEAAVLTGSLGMLPSASLGGSVDLYEPVHGSAPDIAGQGKANPIGAIGSAAMLLRHTCKLEAEAHALELSIRRTLDEGYGTPDLSSAPIQVSTSALGDRVRRHLAEIARGH
ncbi:MAG: 3-isopropylmalate dehydrogenase [Acidobacteria bacterium]|nr:3-isopropylmalate dehydrogenase [Acidobacteriota bacterium]MCW5969890.1 3-isopropylmalate dehydrogenase [Blastocatellales bacterium]